MKVTLYTLLLFLLFSFHSNAQHDYLRFENNSIKEGLSNNWIRSIIQDQQGFLWLGTNNGLNRYDGYSFKSYKKKGQGLNSLSSNQITDLFRRNNGDLWIATAGGGFNLYKQDMDHFEVYQRNPEDSNSLTSNFVNCIHEDHNGMLWIGTEGKGLNKYDIAQDKFTLYTSITSKSLYSDYINVVFEDHKHRIWIGSNNGGLFQYIEDTDSFKRFNLDPFGLGFLKDMSVRIIFEDSKKQLWIGTDGDGLFLYNEDQNLLRQFISGTNTNSLNSNVIYAIEEDNRGNIWIGTENGGLSVFDPFNQTIHSYSYDELDQYSLSNNSIHALYKDQKGNMWIGTFNAGVDMVNIDAKNFIHYREKNIAAGLNHNNILSICEDSSQKVWIGTDGGGLNILDPDTQTFSNFSHRTDDVQSICGDHILSICEMNNGHIWVGTWGSGISVFNSKQEIIKHYNYEALDVSSLSSDNVWVIFQDSDGNIWVGTFGGGLNLYNPVEDAFIRYPYGPHIHYGTSSNKISAIVESTDRHIWIGTDGGGLNRFDKQKKSFQYYFKDEQNNSLSSNAIKNVFVDHTDNLWISTANGLNHYDLSGKEFTNYTEEDGLNGNIVKGVQEDNDHNLWISTNIGITKFNREKHTFENYSSDDGLQAGEFKEHAICKTKSGKMYFGGNEGFNTFWPEKVKKIKFDPPLIITNFQIFNKDVRVSMLNQYNTPLQKNITLTDKISLPYSSSVFSFDFASLNFVSEKKKAYKYRLLNFEEQWQEVGSQHSSTYTNIDPGEYTFQLKGLNNDGTWASSMTELHLEITPPFWKTWWFRTLAGLLLAGSIIGIYKRRTRLIKKRNEILEQKVKARTRELHLSTEKEKKARKEAENAHVAAERANKAKSVFLATMSHEIRTPMNGVIGMSNLLLETHLSDEQRTFAETIGISAENLLTVINDILDFSKIESGKMELERHDFELRTCIEEVLDVFIQKANKKGLDLIYQVDAKIPAHIIGDPVRIRQVLLNLVGNALKFTDQGEIFVSVKMGEQFESNEFSLLFEVKDTGIGIPKDKRNRLFKAFSQVDSTTARKYGGTGLGLIISKRLIEIMGGTIGIESDVGIGSTFHFSIIALPGIQSVPNYMTCGIEAFRGKRILIVDDNPTNLQILDAQLKLWNCKPTLATSGLEALSLTNDSKPFDLVLTDMQMPEMDGVQFTRRLRNKWPSLPVILLSSLGDNAFKDNHGLFSSSLTKPVKQHQLYKHILQQFKNPGSSIKAKKSSLKKLTEDFAKKYPAKILVAEDNLINQMVIKRTLSRLGYSSKIANNGIEVLDLMRGESFDIILMDIQMPEMDGLETTRKLRTLPIDQPVIIAMTANAMKSDETECLGAGMNDFLSKPVKVNLLMDKLKEWSKSVNIDLYLSSKDNP